MIVTCPKCKERFSVKEEQKYIDCPFCKEEFSAPKKEEQKINDTTSTKKAWDSLFKKENNE